MSGIKDALTRKLGPLPAWAWAVIAFIAVYWYRNRSGNTSSATTGTTTAPTPQSPVVLQPGESVYDPNSGGLSTAPGGDTTSGTTAPDPGASGDPWQAIATLLGGLLGNGGAGAGATTGPSTGGAGNSTKKRRAKTKTAHTKPKLRKGISASKVTQRARSMSTIRKGTGGRVKAIPRVKLPKGGRGRTVVTATKSMARQRPGLSTIRHAAPVQHPQSSARRVQAAQPGTARPSAPPARTARTPAKPKPKPPKRRK